MSHTTNLRNNTSEKSPCAGEVRRGNTDLLRALGSDSAEDIRIDFDTARDVRLAIPNQSEQSDTEEGGPRGSSNPPSARPRTSPRTPKDGSDWLRDRFMRRGKRKVGVMESLKAIVKSSWLNLLFVFIPISWALHFTNDQNNWPFEVIFPISLIALVPLEKSLKYGGDQISLYCGKEIGDFIIVTMNNAVEATLAIILLVKCELRLLQSTIIGVILLHLLLVPGVAFIIGGAKLIYQSLNQHSAQLNHILLLMGALTLVLPTALYATLQNADAMSDDSIREDLLKVSHALAIILLIVYAYSRVFLYDPPGENNAFRALPDAPTALLEEERKLLHEEPEVNQWVCIAFLLATIGLMAPSAEWVCSLSSVFPTYSGLPRFRYFGLIVLPLSSYTADAILAAGYFVRTTLRYLIGWKSPPPRVAKARSIEVSIQFNLLWLPLIILLGWWTNRPITLLFDAFEVTILIGACFLVNFVTADAKTNWAEGATMVSFYIMIAITAWFHIGNESISRLLEAGQCSE
ncbi:hypothetical protein BT96DRAFT_825692 [Gymnopus androsaceus JB14]|uniref:Sodium/calcium exchanger membrane region domain-containing protein n=1 Tax=Gymnopus androsaceus JB14 TaxID=1447944 RepID=A0A6A4HDK5_9AGAR|nr:hypothetical protein BT96DRAFT_825692 [Gymnopus androsaceus JB14]